MSFLKAGPVLWLLGIAPALCATNFQSSFGAAQALIATRDVAGNIYVAGSTTTASIPVTPGAFQQTFIKSVCGYIPGPHGSPGPPIPCGHGFVAKVDPTGTRVLWATYLGGESGDSIWAICVDPSGSVYVTGSTGSATFPITPGAWVTTFPPEPSYLGFIAKFSPDGTKLLFSTYMPGGSGSAIAVDDSSNVFVAGTAQDDTFRTTPGAFQTKIFPNSTDAFVLKLNASGSAPIYSTLIGGTFADVAFALAIDGQGDAFIAGYTASIPAYQNLAGGNLVPFPSTPGALYQPGFGADAFIRRVQSHRNGAHLFERLRRPEQR